MKEIQELIQKRDQRNAKKEANELANIAILTLLLALALIALLFLTLDKHYEFDHLKDHEESVEKVTFGPKMAENESWDTLKTFVSLKPKYKSESPPIHFTTNRTKVRKECSGSALTNACNQRHLTKSGYQDKIIIHYTSNNEVLRETICHEILHSIVKRGDSWHEFVYDMADEEVCYSH